MMVTLVSKGKLKKLNDQVEGLKNQKIELRKNLYHTQRQLKTKDAKLLKNKKMIAELKSEIKINKNLLKVANKNQYMQSSTGIECPKGHSYSVWVIQAAIKLQVKCNQSYRQVQQSLTVLAFLMGLEMKSPCANTIRQWVHKFGKSELEKEAENTQSKVLIIDESIGIGQEKVLLILGVKNWAENPHNLKHEDAIVSGVKTKKSWTGIGIAEEIKAIKGDKKYVVSDNSSTLKKACELSGLVHVSDCTHFMGNWIKNYCEKNEECIKLLGYMSKIRSQWGQTDYSGMITPNMRAKSKFLNMFAISDWLEKVLNGFPLMNADEQKRVSFVQELSNCVKEIICINKIIKILSVMLKSEGITCKTKDQIEFFFSEDKKKYPILEKMEKAMLEYAEKIKLSLPEETSILCCSDLIESYFGKFKYRNEKTSFQGITQDVLSITLFGNNFTNEQVKQAMESTSWADVSAWATENLVTSFAKTKRNFWQKVLPKIA